MGAFAVEDRELPPAIPRCDLPLALEPLGIASRTRQATTSPVVSTTHQSSLPVPVRQARADLGDPHSSARLKEYLTPWTNGGPTIIVEPIGRARAHSRVSLGHSTHSLHDAGNAPGEAGCTGPLYRRGCHGCGVPRIGRTPHLSRSTRRRCCDASSTPPREDWVPGPRMHRHVGDDGASQSRRGSS